jgi:hypothetical protein
VAACAAVRRGSTAAAGLGGLPVSGTLLLAGRPVEPEWLAACRAVPLAAGLRAGVTALPGVLVARCLGAGGRACEGVADSGSGGGCGRWRWLREAVPPRIWST